MKRLILLLLLLLLLSLNSASPVFAAKRVALVIGNGAYRIGPLRNPTNDAEDIADKIKKLGFEVTLVKDADQRTMERNIETFQNSFPGADIRLFYYAGHGVQVKGVNYLLPVNIDVQYEDDIKYEAVDAGRVIDSMAEAGKGVNIVILDACRNNPFKRSFRTTMRGLARMQEQEGSIIIYATSPGDVAADGHGRNGLFTEHFLKYLDNPGLNLNQIFKRTGRAVASVTNNRQRPWISIGVYEEVYLAGQKNEVQNTPVSNPPTSVAPSPGAGTPSLSGEGDTWVDPTSGIEFVRISGGCYQMGCNNGGNDEKPIHEVCVDDFWMSKYEVTQAEWELIMGSNPSYFKGDRYPVSELSWDDAQAFIQKLNGKGNGSFRLPSEAEWEYASRSGGKDEEYAGGSNVDQVAWYDLNSGDKTHTVGGKAPNSLGLYDMSGNVWEWCEDSYDKGAYSKHPRNNPIYSGGRDRRVIRGGSWDDSSRDVRSANRDWYQPGDSPVNIGLRLLRTN